MRFFVRRGAIAATFLLFQHEYGDMTDRQPRMIFVYNADGGLLNALKDAVWKAASPSTYPCSLCALTYGYVSMHGRWRRFLGTLAHTKVFHHRDDFALAFPDHGIALPAILLADSDSTLQVLVSADVLDALPDLDALIALVKEQLAFAGTEAQVSAARTG